MQEAGSLWCLNFNQLQPGPPDRAEVELGRVLPVTHCETVTVPWKVMWLPGLLGLPSFPLATLAVFTPSRVHVGCHYAEMYAGFSNTPSASSALRATN